MGQNRSRNRAKSKADTKALSHNNQKAEQREHDEALAPVESSQGLVEQVRDEILSIKRQLEDFHTECYHFAHDTKEPLIYCLKLLQYIKQDVANENLPRMDYLNTIEKGLSSILTGVQDLLHFLVLKKPSDNETVIDLRELIQDVAHGLGEVEGKKLHIVFTNPLPRIRGIKSRWQKVFQNLLVNALVHGQKKDIKVSLKFMPPDKLFVQDNGCGIDKAKWPHLFEPFGNLSPLLKNTGSGLFYVRKILREHGAEIELYKTGSKGTTFLISLGGLVV